VRQTIKTIVVATAITASATAIQQVARANFVPQAATDNELKQSKSADIHSITEPLQFASDGPIAFVDLQQQITFSYLPLRLDPPPVTSSDNANTTNASTEAPQPGSLERPEPREALAPARDIGRAKRYASLEPPRDIDRSDRSPEHQLGLPISRIQFDAPALAPMSHTFFCLKYRDDCKVDKTVSTDTIVTLTSDKRAELERVNAAVNRAIIPQPNTKGLAGEVWLISPKAGECHDYAVTKRHELLALGWPEQDLLLSEVVTTWGEHHLVLVVRTSDGDFVADNLNPNIRIWSQTHYQWVRIQSPGNPMIWSTLANTTVRAKARTARPADPS
jgi:predicted transglutaminase-like cysteine proteinase